VSWCLRVRYLEVFIVYFSLINLYSFYLCFSDKRKSIKNKWRIKESILLFVSFIGGCFGFYLGMRLFSHKTRKLKFEILIPLFIIMWSYLMLKVVIL